MDKAKDGLPSAALTFAEQGLPVFPCRARGKVPLTKTGFKAASCDPEQVTAWWGKTPRANIGIPTGEAFVVLDVDPRSGGDTNLAALVAKHGELPLTPKAKTGGGGWHYFFASNGKLRTRKIAQGLDLKGGGGYVIAPPSIHPSGGVYSWEIPLDTPLAPLPEWLLAERAKPERAKAIPERIREGERNSTLTRFAGSLRRQGKSEEEILGALAEVNRTRCVPPLPSTEVAGIAYSVAQYPVVESIHTTDMGNAIRLIADHGQDVRYSHRLNRWFVWDGRVWKEDDAGGVDLRAKSTVQGMYREAGELSDEKERRALASYAMKAESLVKRRAMIESAKSEPGVPIQPSDLDCDPWLFNCQNGTLALRTGELREHRREDLITKMVPVDYDPAATCPTWHKFLDRVTDGDRNLRTFLQRAVGYSLTGIVNERAFFWLYGTGANGKTTFLETIRAITGEYGLRSPTEMLLLKRNVGGIPHDQARLRGMRFVSSSEADPGRRLAEALLKDLTGGDTVAARFLYGNTFEFQPSHKLWLTTNHKLPIKGTEDAIWDRIRFIRFTVRIPPEEQDRELQDKLRLELPGILRWAVEGCMDWQERGGLCPPASVLSATAEYRQEMDTLGNFIGDCCITGEGLSATIGALYTEYERWSKDNGNDPLTKRAFGMALKERGFGPEDKNRTMKGRYRGGIALLTEPRSESEAA